jgi:pimeloyl-ACP methyl ester carboxylesterase
MQGLRTESFGLTKEEKEALNAGMNFSGIQLFNYVIAEDLPVTAKTLPVPVIIIQGKDDLFSPTRLVASYFKEMSAPRKGMTIIEGAGHFAVTTNQPQFLDALLRLLKGNAR